MSVKVGEIWDTVPGSGLCVSPRRFGPPRRCGPQTGVSLDLFNRIDRRYDLITVTKKNVDLSHQRHKIRNCHWNLFLHFPSNISHFFGYEYDYGTWNRIFQSYLISDLYLMYILNDFKKSNVCCFCYNSFLHKETVKHSIVCSYGLQSWCRSLYIN